MCNELYAEVPIRLWSTRLWYDGNDYLAIKERLLQQYPSVTQEDERQMITQTLLKCNGNLDIFEQFYNENQELYSTILSKVLKF